MYANVQPKEITVFAKRIKQLREDNGHSLESFSDLTGISKSQLHRLEKGENEPSGETLTKLSQMFNISTDYLLGLVEDKTAHLEEEDLSPLERRLLTAARTGDLEQLMETALSIKRSHQSGSTGSQPAFNR